MSKCSYIVSWYECDSMSMAGGNWDLTTEAFSNLKDATAFANKIPRDAYPVTLVKTELIRSWRQKCS